MKTFSQENNVLLCSDGIDNDNNGQIDCEDANCIALLSQVYVDGCAICGDGISFGDTILNYVSGCNFSDPFPNGALGINDYSGNAGDEPEFVFLGNGGFIEIGFTNNLLTNSGDNVNDLWIFEVGAVEPMTISLRPFDTWTLNELNSLSIPFNGSFYEFGGLGGAVSFLDIDYVMPGYNYGELKFDAVKLTDVLGDNSDCQGFTPGADVDAVCALSSINIQQPQALFTSNSTICENECIDFINESTNAQNFYWTFEGANVVNSNLENPTNICFANAGSFEIQLIVENENLFDTVLLEIQVISAPIVNLGVDTILCEGQSITISYQTQNYETLQWFNNSILEDQIIANSGTYWLNVTNQNCTASDSINIQFENPSISLGNDTLICSGDYFELNAFQSGATYEWQDGSSNATFPVSETGLYSVELSIGSCNESDSIYILVNQKPLVDLGNDTTLCYFDNIELNSSNFTSNHLWSTNETTSIIYPTISGAYWVQVEENSCLSYDTVLISILDKLETPFLGESLTLCNGSSLNLNVENTLASNYLWNNNDTLPAIEVNNEGLYQVAISNECESVISNLIEIKYKYCNCIVEFPNVFSPNNDNINDSFFPIYDCIINDYQLQIFNRWGELVFRSNNINEKWNGLYHSKELNSAVFVYIMTANVVDNNESTDIILKGNVTLLK